MVLPVIGPCAVWGFTDSDQPMAQPSQLPRALPSPSSAGEPRARAKAPPLPALIHCWLSGPSPGEGLLCLGFSLKPPQVGQQQAAARSFSKASEELQPGPRWEGEAPGLTDQPSNPKQATRAIFAGGEGLLFFFSQPPHSTRSVAAELGR